MWRLVLLHLFLLGRMLLLDLLRLLSVALLHLLFLRLVVVFLSGLLVFFFLLLPEFLVILCLLGSELFLLLLIFLVGIGVAGTGRWELMGLQVAGVIGVGLSLSRIFWTSLCAGPSFISARGIRRRRLVCAARLFRGHDTGFKVGRLDCSGDRRLALIGGGAQLGIRAGGLRMLSLNRHGRDMPLMGRRLVFRPRTRLDAARTAVVADTIHGHLLLTTVSL